MPLATKCTYPLPEEERFVAMQLSPSTPLGWLHLQLQVRLDRARQEHDLGASAVEWVIITAVLVALAAALGAFIFGFVMDQTDDITPPPVPGGP